MSQPFIRDINTYINTPQVGVALEDNFDQTLFAWQSLAVGTPTIARNTSYDSHGGLACAECTTSAGSGDVAGIYRDIGSPQQAEEFEINLDFASLTDVSQMEIDVSVYCYLQANSANAEKLFSVVWTGSGWKYRTAGGSYITFTGLPTPNYDTTYAVWHKFRMTGRPIEGNYLNVSLDDSTVEINNACVENSASGKQGLRAYAVMTNLNAVVRTLLIDNVKLILR